MFNNLLKYHHTGNPVYQFTAFDVSSEQYPSHSESAAYEYGVEYDRYDIPKTLHVALAKAGNPAEDNVFKNGQVQGCLRFLPTDGPYMIRDAIESGIWKNVELLDGPLPSASDIYEASRIAVSPRITSDLDRKRIVDNLVYANVDIGVRLGVSKMVGIMYDRVWNSVYVKRGVPVKYLSKPFYVDDGQPIIIGEIDTSPSVLIELQRRFEQQLIQGTIRAVDIEPATWMMHYYHVHQRLPSLDEVSHRFVAAGQSNQKYEVISA